MRQTCGRSSSDRAPPCPGGGSEFEPRRPLQYGAASPAPCIMVAWPSGKAKVCKTFIHQFKSGRHLQKIGKHRKVLADFTFSLFTFRSSQKRRTDLGRAKSVPIRQRKLLCESARAFLLSAPPWLRNPRLWVMDALARYCIIFVQCIAIFVQTIYNKIERKEGSL